MKKSVREYVSFKVNVIISKVKFGCEFSVVCFGLDVEFSPFKFVEWCRNSKNLGYGFHKENKRKIRGD